MDYETRTIWTHLQNTESTYQRWDSEADSTLYYFAEDESPHDSAKEELAEKLKISVSKSLTDRASGMALDLLIGCLNDVDWEEIADGFLDGKTLPEPKEEEAAPKNHCDK